MKTRDVIAIERKIASELHSRIASGVIVRRDQALQHLMIKGRRAPMVKA
jgi:hypothetical protein